MSNDVIAPQIQPHKFPLFLQHADVFPVSRHLFSLYHPPLSPAPTLICFSFISCFASHSKDFHDQWFWMTSSLLLCFISIFCLLFIVLIRVWNDCLLVSLNVVGLSQWVIISCGQQSSLSYWPLTSLSQFIHLILRFCFMLSTFLDIVDVAKKQANPCLHATWVGNIKDN